MLKAKQPEQPITKTQMLSWLNRITNACETKIQALGSGTIYCLLLNHFFPGAIPGSKIMMLPKNQFDFRCNLKRLQDGLHTINAKTITFDIYRVSEQNYQENWKLITKLHKHFLQSRSTPVHGDSVIYQQEPNKVNHSTDYGPLLLSMPNAINTPIKGLSRNFDQNGRIRIQSINQIDQIKRIVTNEQNNDKMKVILLKKMLGLHEELVEQEIDPKDLLTGFKRCDEIVIIE